METAEIGDLANKYFLLFLDYLPKIIGAIIILVIGLFVIKFLMNLLRKFFNKRNYDEALKNFVVNVSDIALKVILLISVIAKLGIETSSLVAIFGAASLAIGLAIQGSLANFAGGVILILLRPFRIGDWVEADGTSGTVKEISMFYTKVINGSDLLVMIPNGELANKKIINYSAEGKRIDYMKVRVAYGTDIQKAREVLIDLLKGQKGVFTDPAPAVVVDQLAPDNITLSVQFASSTADFWRIHYYTLEHMEECLNAAGIQIAYPKYDVNLIQKEG